MRKGQDGPGEGERGEGRVGGKEAALAGEREAGLSAPGKVAIMYANTYRVGTDPSIMAYFLVMRRPRPPPSNTSHI